MNANVMLRCLLIGFLSVATLSADDNWPQFRGHKGNGIGSGNPPTEWNVESGKNVAWKTPIPGLGHSAPIVWGDRIFLTTAVNSVQQTPSVETGWVGGAGESAKDSGDWSWQVMCLNLKDGTPIWTKEARKGQPSIKRHLKRHNLSHPIDIGGAQQQDPDCAGQN